MLPRLTMPGLGLPLAVVACCGAASAAPAPGAAVDITVQSGEWDSGDRGDPFVIRDGETGPYLLTYSACNRAIVTESTWGQWMTGRATSPDGASWTPAENRQPVLPARKLLEGDVLNPDEMSGVFDSLWAFGACVRKDADMYKMWYTGWNGDTEHAGEGIENKIDFRIGYATSPDGIRWTKHAGKTGAGSTFGLGPAPRPGSGQAVAPDAKGVAHPWVLQESGAYRMWYEGFDGKVWRILYATSSDGIAWTRSGVVLEPGGDGDADERGVRHPIVVFRKGQFELWYQGQSRSSPDTHVMRAASADGASWKKVPGEVVLHPPDPLDGTERLYVGSVLTLPDGACRVFFAKENASKRPVTGGAVLVKQHRLYMEVLNP